MSAAEQPHPADATHRPRPWCTEACQSADLSPLLNPRMSWLWDQLAAAADRRGDRDLTTGGTTVTLPTDASQRAAVLGLIDVGTPKAGQKVRIDLAILTQRLQARDPGLTPGLLAAHATGRVLAAKAEAAAIKEKALAQLADKAAAAFSGIPPTAPYRPNIRTIWPTLQRNGWVARLAAATRHATIINHAAATLAKLPTPPRRIDRRRLADAVTGSPHALDAGHLPGLILAVLGATGHIPPGLNKRAAWGAIGVDCDDLTGGLTVLGIYPADWQVPSSHAPTLTPRILARCTWPSPPHADAWVFVTENPSVVTAAADIADERHDGQGPIRLMCTVGTPSALEIAAIARLAEAGWNIAVRADFDEAGINHVTALLAGVPQAHPWRMNSTDYLHSVSDLNDDDARLAKGSIPATPWDPELRRSMTTTGFAAYEESLIEHLLSDLVVGRPPATSSGQVTV